jgi:hypothetical protein
METTIEKIRHSYQKLVLSGDPESSNKIASMILDWYDPIYYNRIRDGKSGYEENHDLVEFIMTFLRLNGTNKFRQISWLPCALNRASVTKVN